MGNQIIRKIMPYVIIFDNNAFCVKNYEYQDIYACEIRLSKSQKDFIRSLSHNSSPIEKDGITSVYLYKSDPYGINGVNSESYKSYMQKYESLISLWDHGAWPELPKEYIKDVLNVGLTN